MAGPEDVDDEVRHVVATQRVFWSYNLKGKRKKRLKDRMVLTWSTDRTVRAFDIRSGEEYWSAHDVDAELGLFCEPASLLAVAVSFLASGAVRFIFFPSLEADYMRAELAFPIGTPFAVTQEAAERLIAGAYRVNADVGGTSIKSVSVTIGGKISGSGGPGGGTSSTVASHLASVQVQLTEEPYRTLPATDLERRWRAAVGPIAGVEKLSYVAEFFRGGSSLGFDRRSSFIGGTGRSG